MEYRAAAKIMQACVKLSNVPLKAHLINAVKNKTKLFELMVLDDTELDELSKGKTVAGIELSDLEVMTVSELKEALKKAEEKTVAARRVSDQKDDKINELSEEVAKLELKAEKAKKGAEKLKLDADPKADITKSCLLSLADVSGDMQASTTQLIQILNKANDEQLGHDFFKQMALTVSQLHTGLDEILRDLPDDAEPVDTSWFTPEMGKAEE